MMAVVPLLAASLGCSNWLMENSYVLSGRTMDLGLPTQSFGLQTLPAGGTLSSLVKPVSTARYGSVGAIPLANSPWGKNVHGFTGGLNERGLSCDVQTLTSSEMGPASNTSKDVYVLYFCEFVLATFADTKTLGAALRNGSVHVWGDASTSGSGGFHHSVRDAAGLSLVVEYVGGGMQVYDDPNDGKLGFGLMTNEPEYPFQLRNVQHYMWKQQMARPAVTMPGTWYPDERFLRLHLVKSAMPPPANYQAAVLQAEHVLNVITVPMGSQMGTDSGAGEGQGDHTLFGVIYDHKNATMYFRTVDNHNFQRLRLADVPLSPGSAAKFLSLGAANGLPWYNDAAHAFA